MSFEDFIKELEKENKTIFSAHTIKISVISFRAQLKRAYNHGLDQGKQFEKDLKSFDKKDGFGDIFGDLFKKK